MHWNEHTEKRIIESLNKRPRRSTLEQWRRSRIYDCLSLAVFTATVLAVIIAALVLTGSWSGAQTTTTQPDLGGPVATSPRLLVCWDEHGYPVPQDRLQQPSCPPCWTDTAPVTTVPLGKQVCGVPEVKVEIATAAVAVRVSSPTFTG